MIAVRVDTTEIFFYREMRLRQILREFDMRIIHNDKHFPQLLLLS